MNLRTLIAASAALLFLTAQTSRAGAITIGFSDSGWYDNTGLHDSGNKNYIAGNAGNTFHDYIVFAIPNTPGQVITGARLELQQPSNGYSGPSGGLTYEVGDAPGQTAANVELSHTGATSIFNSLGTAGFGSVLVTPATDGHLVTLNLNASGIAALNAAEGTSFVFGGRFDTTVSNQYTFGFSGLPGDTRELILTTRTSTAVPEPASLTLLGLGGLGLLGYARRRRKTAAA